MLMTPKMIEDARLEFKELGREGVRGALLANRWPKEKLDLARRWLEQEDARSWQQRVGPGPGKPKAKWKAKWFGYAVIAVAVVAGLARLLRFI